MGGNFYLGNWFVLEYETATKSDWQMPSEGGHLEQTANVEELWVFPENINIPPEEVQVGPVEWFTYVIQPSQFYLTQPSQFGFYINSLGPFGFYLEPIGI